MNTANIVGIIPARMGSSRLPGKPLVPILGMPMIGHVYCRSRLSPSLSSVYVATCDAEIADYVESIGGRAIMTKDTHERACDRAAEAAEKIEQEQGRLIDVVVMIQGDEPMLTPRMLDSAVRGLTKDPNVQCVNLMASIESEEDFQDPNEIKVVVDRNNDAIYFSREPIPSAKKFKGRMPMYKQVCIIPFRREYLRTFVELEPTPLEQIESIDMLRILEHGGRVRMVLEESRSFSVDTPEDRAFVEECMKGDTLLSEYMK